MNEVAPLRPDGLTLAAAMTDAARRRPQIARIPATHRSDFTNVLIDAWAKVCRILTFYNDRIAAEGYLDSAVEPFSVLTLATMAGQTRIPAVSATTYLTVRVTDVAGQPDRLSVSPDHPLVVQNVPPAGQLPVVFESSDPLELRAAWNAMPVQPERRTATPMLRPTSRSLRLAGTDSGARAGAMLYLRADRADLPQSWLVAITGVEIDRRQGCTIVTWAEPLDAAGGDWSYPLAEAVLLVRSAGLFGNNAAGWSDVPDATKAAIGVRAGGVLRHIDAASDGATPIWRSAAIPGDVQAIISTSEDSLYAVGSGAWVSEDHGVSWRALKLPKGRYDLRAVATAAATLYVGDASGKVVQSSDDGATWAVLSPLVAWTPATGLGRDVLDALHLAKRPTAQVWPLTGAIRALVIAAQSGDLFAGTDHGILRRAPNDLAWTPFNAGLPQVNPDSGAAAVAIAALVEFAGWLVAATDYGLFASPLDRPGWFAVDTPTLPPGAQLHDLAANVVAVDGAPVATLFVASAAGIAATPDLNRWADFSISTDQGNPGVHRLVAGPSGVIAATDGGVTRSVADAPCWSYWAMQELDLFTADVSLATGLDKGLISAGLIARFARFAITLSSNAQVTVIDPGKVWEVAQPGAHAAVYRLYAEGRLRVAHRIAIVPGDVRAVAMTSIASVVAVAPGAVLNTEWPDFTTGGTALLLDRKAMGAEPPSRLALIGTSQAVTAQPAMRSITGDETVAARAFGKQATVTRVTLDGPDLPAVDPRTATVWFDGRAAAPYAPQVVAVAGIGGGELTLGPEAAEILPGRRLIVSGPRPLAAVMPKAAPDPASPGPHCLADIAPQLDQAGVPAALKDCLSAAGVKLSPDPAVEVIVPGSRWLLQDGGRAWRLDASDGAIAIASVGLVEVTDADEAAGQWAVIGPDGERYHPAADMHVVLVPATADMAVHAEVVTVTAIAPAANGRWRVAIEPGLHGLYDPSSCRVSANVVTATQGETVPPEILGTGHPSRANQVFHLNRGPLSYARDGDGDGDGTPRPLLALEVNGDTGRSLRFGAQPAAIRGEAWHRTAGLSRHDPTDRVYELVTNVGGSTTIRFGDGQHGTRLPSGENNVAARYRVGAGRTGNVAANTLTALRKRVPGIRSVTNPLAATGAADAEPIEHLRTRTRDRATAVDRVVTVDDHARFALTYPGVQSAIATLIARPDENLYILLTVAPVGADQDWAGLRASLDAVSARRVALKIVTARTLLARVDLAITLAADADGDSVLAAVRARLAAAFGADDRPLGVPLDPAEIAAVTKAVPGVERVTVGRIRRPAAAAAATPGVPDRIAIDPAGIRIERRP